MLALQLLARPRRIRAPRGAMDPIERTDEELMAAWVRGDEAACGLLVARYAPLLGGIFRRQVGVDEAGDLVQQTFLQLHRARLDFKPGARLRPWLLTIALNLAREHLRKQGRRRTGTLGDVDPEARDAPPAGRELEGREDAARVRAALRELPAAQREVIELHWFQGLPFAQVAERVGASVSAAKVRAHRGYGRLRELLERPRAEGVRAEDGHGLR